MEAANRFRQERRCGWRSNRSRAGWVLLILLLAACGLCQSAALRCSRQIGQFSPGVSLRYEEALTPGAADAALRYAQSEQNAGAVVPTFWREDELTMQAPASGRVRQALCLGFDGQANAVYGADYLAGTAPGSGSTAACAVSAPLAWSLWGSQDVIGQTLTLQTADGEESRYLVCGIFCCGEELLLYTAGSGQAFSCLELTNVSRDHPTQSVRQFLAGAGLGEPERICYDEAMAWCADVLARLPQTLLAAACLAGLLFGLPWSRPMRRLLWFAAALAAALLLPGWLAGLPGWLVPDRWGSMAAWSALLEAGRERLSDWMTLVPTARDVLVRLRLIETCLGVTGSLLCGLTACLVWVLSRK